MDAPPFFMYAGYRAKPTGLNVVGLRRAGFTAPQIGELKKAYTLLYRSKLALNEALDRVSKEIATPEALHLVRFVRASKRGICRE
jgi:UDP-N-acetylglucosamine acyltransferase